MILIKMRIIIFFFFWYGCFEIYANLICDKYYNTGIPEECFYWQTKDILFKEIVIILLEAM